YRRARSGEIPRFTGISDPFEPPVSPDLQLRTDMTAPDACTAEVVALALRLVRG
ncbi:MAG: adenylyl-sulfate kinase, partial [Phycisphaerales bacterium]